MTYRPRTEAYERLVLDGGWLTAAQLAMETGQSDRTVDRSLHRQARAGWVEKRIVYLAGADAPPGFNTNFNPQRNPNVNRRVEFKAI